MTMTGLVTRGMLVGLLAGVLAFGIARIIGEPQLDRSIDFEQQMRQARGEAPEPALVGRGTQAGIGLFVGIAVYGVTLGGLFSLVFAAAYGRIAALDARATAALLGLVGFLVVFVVPALKYPPNPPGIGDAATIGRRTALYFTMIAISLATAVAATKLGYRLAIRLGIWTGALGAIAVFIAMVGIAQFLLPAIGEVPAGFPAVVLWRFRVAALAIQAVLWATLGIGFGVAVENRFALLRGSDRQRRMSR